MQNPLYPIFLKLHQLEVLIVGGGFVALEKLSFMLKSSPEACVTLVAIDFTQEIQELGHQHGVTFITAVYHSDYLTGKDMVIGATDDTEVNRGIYHDCKQRHLLVNIADTPDLCDFYLGGIVTKGNLKIAISTNGKSPTVAKRLRQFFEEIIPENINQFLDNIHLYRSTLKGDFQEKIDKLNSITEPLIHKK